ncbi:MAG TPA: hypothetical protein VN282_19555 [Pyrinomonadaceae bacterium]|nr:hypothetical protein [Pyrinomonadaceae bacterium]
MSDNGSHDYLDLLIANQYRARRFYLVFAGILLAVGVLIILFSQMYPGLSQDIFKQLLALGGGFISSLSAFPFKEIMNRKEKAETLKAVKKKRLLLEKATDKASKAERERIDTVVWQSVEKIVVGN